MSLIFLHGAGGRALVWQHQLLAFPLAQAPDLPGRDGATLPGGVPEYLEALRSGLAARRAAPPGDARVVAGTSLGGAIALEWAFRHPDEVAGLILIGAGPRLPVPRDVRELLDSDHARAVEHLVDQWFSPASPRRLKAKSLALAREVPARTLLADLAAAETFEASERLGALRIPALIVCGADDRATPPALSRELHERIAGSDLLIVERAGHMVMLEQPRVVNDAIARFLERFRGSTRSPRATRSAERRTP